MDGLTSSKAEFCEKVKGRVMGVETKKMSKAIAAAPHDDGFLERVKLWPEQTKTFYNDVRNEMRKVTAPSLKEVQATTAVVIITVFLFGVYFWAVDDTIGRFVNWMFKYFTNR